MESTRTIPVGSQCDRIMNYLKNNGTITQLDCTKMNPPILRLASRITDLRKRYHVMIIAKREAVYNEAGKEQSHWTVYRLPSQEELQVEKI